MVSSIVGNYLYGKGLISYEQLNDILIEQRKVRVKLGLIAVAEGLLMQEEADRINELQAVMDKRFGDIAVEKKYLTEGQVEALLKKQGNAYLAFAQVLENKQLMTIEQLEQYMVDFQRENSFTISDMEDIKSDDVDRILPLFLPEGGEKYLNIAGTALRTLMRCVDTEIYVDKAYLTDTFEADNCVLQYVEGEHDTTSSIAGKGKALLPIAITFGKEDFTEINEDSLDAVAELLNCINGLYATTLSQCGISMELYPPELAPEIGSLKANQMLVLPLTIKGQQVNFVVAIDHRIEMK